MYLSDERSELELRREFPGVPIAELNRSLALLSKAGWIQSRESCRTNVVSWSVSCTAVKALQVRLRELFPDAIPALEWRPDTLRLEMVAIRRESARTLLMALRAGHYLHADLVRVSGLQSGTVSDALGRLEFAGMIDERKLRITPRLQAVRFVYELQKQCGIPFS